MSLFAQQLSPEEQRAELQRMVEKAVMPTKMGVSPAHGVVFLVAKDGPLALSDTIVAVRIPDILALAASLVQQIATPMLDSIPVEPLPRVKVPHKLFQVVDGGKS